MKESGFLGKWPVFAVAAIAAFLVFGCNGGSGGEDDAFTISGTVTLNEAGFEGATITLTGDAAETATTDSSGNYSFTDLSEGDYLVAPTLAGQSFSPAEFSVTLIGADATGVGSHADSAPR